MNNRVKHYNQLDPQERLALSLAALTRGDRAEVARLSQSCPQVTLVGPDPENYQLHLRMLSAVRAVISCWVAVAHDVVRDRLLTMVLEADDIARAAQFKAGWKRWSAQWKGIEEATTNFCAEVGLTRDQLFGPKESLLGLIEEARALLDSDARADREVQEHEYERLRRAWSGDLKN